MEEEIEHTRELMIQTALIKGLGANETIQLSEKLDDLMNRYESYTRILNQESHV